MISRGFTDKYIGPATLVGLTKLSPLKNIEPEIIQISSSNTQLVQLGFHNIPAPVS
jgi:hypothetical protein